MELGVENDGRTIKMIVPTPQNRAKPCPVRVCTHVPTRAIVGGIDVGVLDVEFDGKY